MADEARDRPERTKDDAERFHLVEYEGLRDDIRLNISELNAQRRLFLIAPAILYGWVLANSSTIAIEVLAILSWLPVFFHLVMRGLRRATQDLIVRRSRYLALVEKEYAFENLAGWQNYSDGVKKSHNRIGTHKSAVMLPWWIILLALLILASGSLTLAILFPGSTVQDVVVNARRLYQ